MWRFDATPRRVAAPDGDVVGPLSADVAAPRAFREVAPPSGSLDAPGQERCLKVVVAPGPGAPVTARAAVAAWLSPHVSGDVVDAARLLVSELVTNSVRHARLAAGATVRVSVEIFDGFVRIEVEDPGDVAIGAVAPDRERGGGFGLLLVEKLARRWGSTHEGTTCVWAELSTAPAA